MKFLHLGDLHLGKNLGDFDLTEDQRDILDRITDIAVERQVFGVLIAGDIYDRTVPPESAVRLLDDFILRLSEKGIKVFMISGNHDSDERLAFGNGLFKLGGVYIASRYDGSVAKYCFSEGDLCVDIYMLPFVKSSQVRHYLPDVGIESYDDAVKAAISVCDIDPGHINILIAHQFVTAGGSDPELSGSEGLETRTVGTVDKVGADAFYAFDYVALGHIHSPQSVGRNTIRYSGSPLKYSLSEVNNKKSMPLITVEDGGEITVELIPLEPARDVRHITGELKTLTQDADEGSKDDYIYATLTDEEIDSDAPAILRSFYHNLVKVDYDNSHTREIEEVDITQIAGDRTFKELISDFYRQIYGCEISDEEMEIMKEVAKEAGVTDETD